jgi:hypothetical protein
MLSIALFALLAGQDDVARQAARITEKDSRASFDAISRLADLAASSRSAVEGAAGGLPDFYRDALRAELRVRERMGARYPNLKRYSFQFENQSPMAVFADLNSKSGGRLELAILARTAPSAAPLTLNLPDVPVFEALEAACRQSKCGLFHNGWKLALNPVQENVGTFSYRSWLVQVLGTSRSRKIEFGAGSSRRFVLTMQLFGDPEDSVVRVGGAKVSEALDAGGKLVRPIPEEPPPAAPPEAPPRKEGDPVTNVLTGGWNQAEVALEVPPGETLRRVRGWYEVLVAGEWSSFEFDSFDSMVKKQDEHYAVEAGKRTDGDATALVIRVTPKAGLEGFLKSWVGVRGVWAGGPNTPLGLEGKAAGDHVEYLFPLSQVLGGGGALLPRSISVRIPREPFERRVPFEFTDLPVK